MAREAALDSVVDGMEHYFHYCEHTGESAVEIVQDCNGIMDHIKRRQTESFDAMSPEREFQYVGEIPNVVVVKWMKEGFDLFRASSQELRKWIDRNRQEYGYLFVDRKKPNAGIIIKGAR